MNTPKKLSILLMTTFLLISCAKNVSYRDKIVYKTAPIESCHDEDDLKAAEYEKLDRAEYISNQKNVDILLNNLEKIKKQNDKQRAALICYDERIKKNNEEAKKEEENK